jgi:hypothetical protein
MKRTLGNAVLLVGSLAFALVLAELLLRVVGFSRPVFVRADPVLGMAHIPGAEDWYTAEGRSYVRINARGWHDKEHPFRKPPGVTRIAILGDSYTDALQVPQDSAFPAILERTLNSTLPGQYEVLNFGVGGFGTAQELLVLQHYALQYAPDAVILAFTIVNDVSDNSRALRRMAYVPYFTLVDQRLVLDTSARMSRGFLWRARIVALLERHSRVAQLTRAALLSALSVRQTAKEKRRRARLGLRPVEFGADNFRNPPRDSIWTEAWNVTEALISRINLECRSRHIPFYLLSLSDGAQVTPDTARRRALAADLRVPDLFEPERRLERLGLRQGFAVLALAPLFAAQAVATGEYFHGFGDNLGRGHWNERGHRAAASLLSAWLADRLPRDLGRARGRE